MEGEVLGLGVQGHRVNMIVSCPPTPTPQGCLPATAVSEYLADPIRLEAPSSHHPHTSALEQPVLTTATLGAMLLPP